MLKTIAGATFCGSMSLYFAHTSVYVATVARGNSAFIMQSGPDGEKPAATIRNLRGTVIIDQHSKHNRALIMQSD